ncbi:DUF2185 domain-containing protein [Massilia sp. ST3]|uniref:immunity protein Imm33 domain-containing protein n=1 Tax=Massilia sp. ST3 TaxID=2824903 RepID=UPI001B81AD00|nr:DUF2185 domain-containing protein [Massilia sp. ST3]MBQ5947201.1 DUF2185 domain-containing protein [Massilia sp. ST3]
MPSWRLDNGAELAARYRYTFHRPSDARIARVGPGDSVKLIFRFDSDEPDAPEAERMWVEVESADGAGGFTGRLDNVPGHIKDLQLGDPLAFRDIHIIALQSPDGGAGEETLPSRYSGRCFVTRKILYEGERIGYFFREAPGADDDSGWRIMAGDEDDDYMNDDDNVFYVSLGAVLNCDDAIVSLLDAPTGSAFERDQQGEGFVSIEEDC